MSSFTSVPPDRFGDPGFYFTDYVPRALATRDGLVASLGRVYAVAQVEIPGDCGGAWHFVTGDGRVEVNDGAHASPSFTVTFSVDTFRRIQSKEIAPRAAFVKGKVKLRGDVALAMKLAAMIR